MTLSKNKIQVLYLQASPVAGISLPNTRTQYLSMVLRRWSPDKHFVEENKHSSTQTNDQRRLSTNGQQIVLMILSSSLLETVDSAR